MTQQTAPTTTVAVGDFFVASWGYDQTNIDFYRVVAVSGRGFDLVIVSSRAETGEGLAGICQWLGKHGFPDIRVTFGKAQADAYIDDRAIPFLGDFDETRRLLDRLLDHPKWWIPRPESDGPVPDVVIARWISNPHRPNGPARSSAKDLLRELAEAGFEVRRTHAAPSERSPS